MKTTHRIAAAMAGATLLVALGVAVSFRAFHQIEASTEARKLTRARLIRAEDLSWALIGAENGQRGFMLTGDETLLEPYLAVRNQFTGHLAKLRQLTPTKAAQAHLDALAPLAQTKLVEMAQAIELRRRQGLAASVAIMGNGKGQHSLEAIRSEMRAFIRIEENDLAQHDAQFQANMRQLFALLASASLGTLLLALSFAFLFHRDSRQRLKNLVLLETQHLLELQQETNRQLQLTNGTLQVSEEKLAVTLQSIGDGVIATDAAGCVTLLNPLAERLTGWTQAAAAGHPVDEVFRIINQETRQPATVPIKEMLARGTIQGLANHTLLIARDRSECPIADSCAPIRDRGGQVVGAVLVFRDVTKDYLAQATARDSSALVQTILNSVEDGIITLRADDGHIETANPAASRMFGYVAAELIGGGFSRLIPELDRDRPNGSLEYYNGSAEARAAGRGREVVGRRKDGSTFPLEITLSDMRLGGALFFTGILRDITTRKRTEEVLFKAGALQRAIFNSANFSSIATDEKGIIQLFNVGAERMLGYAAAEVLNRITPADISDWQEVIQRAKELSTEQATPITPGFEALVFKASRGIEDIYELNYIRKDGSRFPAVVSVTALRDPQGTIIGYLLIGTDNTARKQIEAEQQQLAQRLRDQQFYTRSLFESNIDALITTDPDGIITDVNKQMEALTDCTRDELIGAPFKGYFTDPERAETSIKLALNQRKVTNYELTARARNGRETMVSYNATTFYDRDRKLQGVFAAARDVTERQRAEEELRRALAELAQASRLKDEFLANMSHELRTPLNAILGLSETLLEQCSGPLTPRQVKSVTTISTSGYHLLALINDILDLSKIEAGRLELYPETVKIDEFCQGCLAFVRTQALQKKIDVTFEPDGRVAKFTADPTRLKQVLVNLLTNAVKFTPEGGRIGLTVAAPAGEDVVRFTVWDTGIGIADQDTPKLFRAFTQIDSGLSRAQEGTGLGLALVAKLVELQGGNVAIASEPGHGSRFTVTLPRIASPTPADAVVPPVATEAVRRNDRRPLILLAEDNAANIQTVGGYLEDMGYAMHYAANGLLAVKLAHELRPALILMDIQMPVMDGLTAILEICADATLKDIPIVALTALAMPGDRERCLAAGATDYLSKPVSLKTLAALVARLVPEKP